MSVLYRNDQRGAYPPSYYAAQADLPPAQPPLRGRIEADLAIVGAGYAGLSAALSAKAQGLNVALIEAHRAGFGASGRNGGQVSPGFNKPMGWIEQRLGREAAHRLWTLSLEALALTRHLADQTGTSITPGVAFGAWSDAEMHGAQDEAKALQDYGHTVQILERDSFCARVKSPVYCGGTLDEAAFHLDPLHLALGLRKMALEAGVQLFEGSAVHHLGKGLVQTAHGHITAPQILLAGNGYLPNLDRKIAARTMPINSFIGATPPLPDPSAVLDADFAVTDARAILNYFRLSPDNRLLFGGRENYTTRFPRDIATRLQARMVQIFPQLDGTGFDYVWGGTLGITATRLPLAIRPAPGVLSVGGFSGHGIALSLLAGQLAAKAISGASEEFDLLAQLPTPPFPGGAMLRAPLLAGAMGLAALRDRFGA